MFIAVCDDNIAERKQTERLLMRESDRRKAVTGIFYVHSYGHQEALLRAPKQYDLFMIDMVNGEVDGLGLALILYQNGITVPICLNVSRIDYRKAYTKLDKPPPNIHFIDKPIKVAELAKIIDQTLEQLSSIVPSIELRTDTDTLYLRESEIIWAKCNAYSTDVYLNDERVVRINGDLTNLYSQICVHPAFYLISKKTLVNINYIDKCSLHKLTLTNGQVLTLSPFAAFEVKKFLSPGS